MDDQAGLKRLHSEHQEAVQQTKAEIAQVQKYKDDYEALRSKLSTLADQVQHEVMVPFGNQAFMPGRLVHTNEVLVLLGDNWFVEQSTKQAASIVTRRMAALDSQLNKLNQQLNMLQPRLSLSSELTSLNEVSKSDNKHDVIEIKEDYDEEKEKAWKDAHRKRMRIYNVEQLRKSQKEDKPGSQCFTDEDVWQRLDLLQQQERVGHEYSKLASDVRVETSVPSEVPVKASKSLHWKDEGPDSTSGSETDEEDEDSEEAERPTVIHFTHSECSSQVFEITGAADSITSPKDVYRMFCAEPSLPKSILKNKQKTSHAEDAARRKVQTVTPADSGSKQDTSTTSTRPVGPSAVSESVIEKTPEMCQESQNSRFCVLAPPDGSIKSDIAHQSDDSKVPRKVSKFKAQRMEEKR